MSQNTAASYVRVPPGEPQNTMAQLEKIRQVAEEQKIKLVREYEDKSNGRSTDDRPGFQQMIADALSDERPFDTIIVYNISRFSRNTSDLTRYRTQLEEAGVRLLSATEPATSLTTEDEN